MAILIYVVVCFVAYIALGKKMKKTAITYNLPKWFVFVNFCSLLPIALWPAVAFGAVFLFDHPTNILATLGLFMLMISYPLFIVGNMLLSFWLYHRVRVLSIILPFIPLSAFIYFIIVFSSV